MQQNREGSVLTLSHSKRTLLSNEEQKQLCGLKKLANSLYSSGQAQIILSKHRNIFRAKPKSRATSADPRFRRERSPDSLKPPTQSLSESVMSISGCESLKDKKPSQSVDSFHYTTGMRNKLSKSHQHSSNCVHWEGERNNSATSRSNIPIKRRPRQDIKKEVVNSEDGREELKETIKGEPNEARKFVERCTMTDFSDSSDSLANTDAPTSYLTTGADYTETINFTDINENPPTDLESYNVYILAESRHTFLSSTFPICRSSSFWEEAQLESKYPFPKATYIREEDSVWTHPVTSRKQSSYTLVPSIPSVAVCSKPEQNGYDFDNTTDIDEYSMTHDCAKSRFFEILMKNCSSTPLFLLGTIAGLVIVMAISWTCATELLWQYFQPPKKEERWYWQYFGVVFGGILYSIECFFNTLSYIFFVPRNPSAAPLKNQRQSNSLDFFK